MSMKQAAISRFTEIVITCRRLLAAGAGEFDEEVVLSFGGESLAVWGRPVAVYLPINSEYYAVISRKNAVLRERAGTKPIKFVSDCIQDSFFPEKMPVLHANFR